MKLLDLKRMVQLEALRRATLQIENFLDDGELRPFEVQRVQMMLAKEYDKQVEKFNFDTHELLTEKVARIQGKEQS